MSTIDKLIKKFYRIPIPRDITFKEMEAVAKHFGCIVDNSSGGRHSCHIIYPELGIVIPIPVHGKHVQEVYIRELKMMFDRIRKEN